MFTTTQGGIRLPPQQAPGPAPGTGTGPATGNPFLPPGIDRRIIDIPPPNETRLKTDEVMVQIRTDIGVERLRAAVANLGVSILASEDFSILGSTAVRLHIDDGRTPAEVIRALAAVQMVAVAQPQYVYNLDQASGAPAPSSSRSDGQPGDAAQYILQKLSLGDVHRMVRGTNVPIAVIDSEIDAAHPDLEGAVTQRYDAVGAPDKPHPHGTGMAGAIGARQRLLGTAPAARLLAVHAFSTSVATPESTTFNILKGINWAVGQGVRVINMSFAGPKDPSLERALKAAYDRNIVLIAAAGNAGSKSPPLYPGADPNVIAVTATDVDDKLFAGANRGKYVSVSAPGVDILVPAPENTYQITTGTSVAAAEVSGIVALLLERNPKLTPADVRRILHSSARRLGPGVRDDNFGSGLVDPLKALQLAIPRTAATTPPPNRRSSNAHPRRARSTPTSALCRTISASRSPGCLGSETAQQHETAQQQRRSVFSRRPTATAWPIALRVVDLLVFELAGEHCQGSDTSAATFRACLEDRLQDSLFCSTEHPEVNGSRQIDRLLSHVLSRRTTHVHHQVPDGHLWRGRVRFSSADWCEA